MSEPIDPKRKAPTGEPVKPAEAPPARDPAAEAAALAAFEAEEAAAASGNGEGAPLVDEQTAKAAAKTEAKKPVEPAKTVAPAAKSETKADAKSEAAKSEAAPAKSTKAEPEQRALAPEDDPNRLPTAPPWWRTLRSDPPIAIRIALGAGLIGLLMFVWWFVTRGSAVDAIISPSKLPSPGKVFGALGAMLDAGFFDSLIDSLERVFKGVGLAAIVGIGLGVLAASQRGLGSALEPLVIFLRSVPMGALLPLTLLLFGIGEKQKAMFIFLAVVPFVFSDTVKAVSIVPERYVETAQTLGATKAQIITKVLVPLALPDIITSLRFLLGLALGYIMLAEVLDAPRGLGTMLNNSQRLGQSEQIYLLLFAIALVAFLMDLLLRTIQRGLFAWRKDL